MTATAASTQKNPYVDVARQAVTPRVEGLAPKTPSWTSIVEAFHKEGNGDREMLLALLGAKAKEDERLAALDILKAEQLRAYTAHITVHGPLFQQQPHHAPAPSLAPSSTLNAPSARRNRGDSNSSSSRRSPSLSANGNSSPEPEGIKTPEEERSSRFETLNGSAKPIVHEVPMLKRKRSGDMDDNAVPARYAVYGASVRSAPSGPPAGSHTQLKRISPYGAPRMLPGISSLVSAATHAHQAEQEQQKQQARRASAGQSYRPSSDARSSYPEQQQPQRSSAPSQQALSPKSLRNLLNDEPRHYNGRVATSDVRSSASEGDDEEIIA